MGMADRMSKRAAGLDANVRAFAGEIAGQINEATQCVIAYAQKKADLRRIGRQLNKTMRRNPVQAMLAVTAIGFIGGMLVRRR